MTISHVLTEEKVFSGEVSSMMYTISEDKSPIDLKTRVGKTREHMTELNKQFSSKSKLSEIEELNTRYL